MKKLLVALFIWPTALLLEAGVVLASLPAAAEVAITADKLPLAPPSRLGPVMGTPVPPPAPAPPASCAVRQDEIPQEFLNILGRLDAPATVSDAGTIPPLPPETAASTRRQSRPAVSVVTGNRRRVNGVTVIQGGGNVKEGQSREGGVTVWRGPPSSR